MKIMKKFGVLFLPVLFLITVPFVDGNRPTHAENPELSTAVFYVQ
jgi:quinol-cytochrome oxidoreductase complex cytochrome b subunit